MSFKQLNVDLDEVVEAMEFRDEMGFDTVWYLDTDTGRVVMIGGDLSFDAHDPGDEFPEDEASDWQRGAWEDCKAVADDDRNRFVEVPQRQSSDGWDVMRRFIDEAPDPRLRERLVRAIEGKGAFRRFKDELSRHPEARERWFAFEAGVKREWAEEWLREIGIESTWSPPARKQGAADWQPKVVGVHHVQITAPRGQEQAAREFYCGVLGLVEVQKPESLRGRGGLWVMAGEFEIHIGSEEGANRAATKAHVAYQVTDIAKWRDRLAKAGVEILDSVPVPGYERFEFRDPFGNRVEMIQERG